MGVRVGFYLCHPEGPFADLTSEAVTRVLERYYTTDDGSSDDPDIARIAARLEAGGVSAVLHEPEAHLRRYEAIVSEGWGLDPRLFALARRFLREGQSALRIASADEATVVDRLAARLRGEGDIATYPREIDNNYFYVRRWDAVRDIVRGLSPRAGFLWNFLLNGRGVGRADGTFPYHSEDGVSRSSFWTHDECAFLGPLLVDAHARAKRDVPDHACAFDSTRAAIAIALEEGLGLGIDVG